jgi:hypothetical protein
VNREEQAYFVLDMTTSIRHEVWELIEKGRIPESFDGHELRVLLSDKFKDAARLSALRQHPHSKRNKDFRNWKATTTGV